MSVDRRAEHDDARPSDGAPRFDARAYSMRKTQDELLELDWFVVALGDSGGVATDGRTASDAGRRTDDIHQRVAVMMGDAAEIAPRADYLKT